MCKIEVKKRVDRQPRINRTAERIDRNVERTFRRNLPEILKKLRLVEPFAKRVILRAADIAEEI